MSPLRVTPGIVSPPENMENRDSFRVRNLKMALGSQRRMPNLLPVSMLALFGAPGCLPAATRGSMFPCTKALKRLSGLSGRTARAADLKAGPPCLLPAAHAANLSWLGLCKGCLEFRD